MVDIPNLQYDLSLSRYFRIHIIFPVKPTIAGFNITLKNVFPTGMGMILVAPKTIDIGATRNSVSNTTNMMRRIGGIFFS
jgi:hypothetical protein